MELSIGGALGLQGGSPAAPGGAAAPPSPPTPPAPRRPGGGGGNPLAVAGDALPSDKFATAPRFFIEVQGMTMATFSECSGLVITIRTDKWEEGGVNGTTLKFPARTDFGNLTLKHGITHSTDLFDWFMKIVGGQKDRRPISVHVYDPGTNSESPIATWSLANAFPVKWTGPSLQNTSNAIAIESVEFAYEGLSKG